MGKIIDINNYKLLQDIKEMKDLIMEQGDSLSDRKIKRPYEQRILKKFIKHSKELDW